MTDLKIEESGTDLRSDSRIVWYIDHGARIAVLVEKANYVPESQYQMNVNGTDVWFVETERWDGNTLTRNNLPSDKNLPPEVIEKLNVDGSIRVNSILYTAIINYKQYSFYIHWPRAEQHQ